MYRQKISWAQKFVIDVQEFELAAARRGVTVLGNAAVAGACPNRGVGVGVGVAGAINDNSTNKCRDNHPAIMSIRAILSSTTLFTFNLIDNLIITPIH